MSTAPTGGSMRRNLSVEDIMGSLTKMNSAGGAFPRTDSEQAFQEFLKRIPSSNSLTAFGSHGSHPDSAAQGLQFSTIQKVANQAAAAYSQPSASDQTGDGGRTAILGVPRVASLDFFRQLLPVNQLNFAGSRPAAVAEGNEDIVEGLAGNMAAGGQIQPEAGAGAVSFHPPPPFAAALPSVPAVVLSSAIATTPTVRRAAEAPQTQNTRRSSSTTSGGGTSSQPGGGSGRYGRSTADGPAKDGSKAELRRARRMLSNRESARRSRRRKQEHLGDLETKIQQLQDEKEDLQEEMDAVQKECAAERAIASVLRRQLEQLQAHVMGFSGSILSGGGVGGDPGGGTVVSGGGEGAAVAEVLPGSARLDPALGHSGSAEWTGVERRIPRVASFPRVASAENLPSRKRIADGEAPPVANGHRRKRPPQAADV